MKSQVRCGAELGNDQRVPRSMPKLHATLASSTLLALVHRGSVAPPGETCVSAPSFPRFAMSAPEAEA
jgi:hypothetical protein